MILVALIAAVLLSTPANGRYIPPSAKALFVETFQSETTYPSINWVASDNEKYSGKFMVDETSNQNIAPIFPGDKSLIAVESHRHYGLSRKLPQPIDVNVGKQFVIQYEFRPTSVWECAGGYLKFFSDPNFDPKRFSGDDHYSIMFGPDRCGGDGKVHFIIQQPDAKSGKLVEHHLTNPPVPHHDFTTHLYQLVINLKDQTFDMYLDMVNMRNGSLLTEFDPPLQPPKEIADPNDRQPDSWVTQERIPDPNAVKPADWDESQPEYIEDPEAVKPEDWDESAPEYVQDPSAERPEDWDEAEDGPWMHPMIPNPVCSESGCGKWLRPRIRNPAYKGRWQRPLVDNPAYKGPWKARLIPNPDFYENSRPTEKIAPISAIGVDWWTTQKDTSIDNILIGRSKKALDAFAKLTSMVKVEGEKAEYMKRVSGPPPPESRPLQTWKFVAVGGFVVGIVAIFIIMRVCCSAQGAKKAKKE